MPPIDRPDGRHWCAPEQEQPDENGEWTCPGCKQLWLFSLDPGYPLWETPEARATRLDQEEADALAAAEAAAAERSED